MGMPDEIDVLRALAHPVRWGILERLAAEPGICACDFTEFFEVSQPTISAHLKTLREAGLVTAQRRGTTICYSLARDQLAQLADRMGGMAATAPALGQPAPPSALPPGRARTGPPRIHAIGGRGDETVSSPGPGRRPPPATGPRRT